VSAPDGSALAAAAARSGSSACAPPTRATSWLRVPLALPQIMSEQANGLPHAIRVRFRMPASTQVGVKLLTWPAGSGFATVTHAWQQGSGGELIPLPFTGEVRDLAFVLPAGACVTELEFGTLGYARSR
jgi:hypothetical protein